MNQQVYLESEILFHYLIKYLNEKYPETLSNEMEHKILDKLRDINFLIDLLIWITERKGK